jgi:hypothetical protein
MKRDILTYSSLAMFRDCRKKYFWRVVAQLVLKNKPEALSFGTLIHACLSTWHKTREIAKVFGLIDDATRARDTDRRQKKFWHLARAMMRGYAARYPAEDFKVLEAEYPFREVPILNPKTNYPSYRFFMSGKCDGILGLPEPEPFLLDRQVGATLMEHKTAAIIDAEYMQRIWCDTQIHLYSDFVSRSTRFKVAGVLYNVLKKPALKQGEGETEAQFEERRAGLLAKSKTGKTTATRKLPESDEEYALRLAEKCSEPDAYFRSVIPLSQDRIADVREDCWDIVQNLLACHRTGRWYQNTSHCLARGRCQYFDLCAHPDNDIVRQELYEHVPPHEELREDEPETEE